MSIVRILSLAIALAFAPSLVACGGSDSEAPAPPTAPEPVPTPEPAPAPTAPAPAPEAAPEAAPMSGAKGDAAAGKALYIQYCASCHGEGGAGDGPVGAALDPKPASHNDGNYMNPKTDAYLYKVIAEGGTAVGKSALMAPWAGTLNDQQIRDVIAFVRSLAVPPYKGS